MFRYQPQGEERDQIINKDLFVYDIVYIVLQQFFVTKDHQLSIEQGSLFCVEAAGSSLLIVTCDEAAQQWTVSKVGLITRKIS